MEIRAAIRSGTKIKLNWPPKSMSVQAKTGNCFLCESKLLEVGLVYCRLMLQLLVSVNHILFFSDRDGS